MESYRSAAERVTNVVLAACFKAEAAAHRQWMDYYLSPNVSLLWRRAV